MMTMLRSLHGKGTNGIDLAVRKVLAGPPFQRLLEQPPDFVHLRLVERRDSDFLKTHARLNKTQD